MNTNAKLALLGGKAIHTEPWAAPAWPPVSDTTAERLKEVYYSRKWSFNGPVEQEFAQAFADYHGAKHGIFMANGTVTLQCALGALDISPGDEVIVPALTWIATAMAVRYLGALPVFVDIDPETLCLDPEKVREAITAKTKAIIPVHLYGSMADIDALLAIAKESNLAVIEDCAHMQGGKWNGRGAGSWGDVGSFSFQESKTVSSGEGGICLTNDDRLADRLYRQKHIGYAAGTTQGKAAQGPPPGLCCHNFRGTEFQAVILMDQLNGLETLIDRYSANAAKIEQRLSGVPGVRVQARGRKASPQGYYSLVFIFDEEPLADVPLQYISEAIAAEGLGLAPTYGPVYRHLLFNLSPEQYRIHGESCPVAETTGTTRSLCLAHQHLMSDDKIIDTIGNIIAKVAENAEELSVYAKQKKQD